MVGFETLTVENTGPVVTIRLNRPERLNSVTTASLLELEAALHGADRDDVEVVVLTGTGRAFCTGADLSTTVGAETVAVAARVVTLMAEVAPPIVVALNGPTAGVGVSIALAGDLVIAGQSAFLLLPFLGIGLVPDGGATHSVLNRIGRSRTALMAFEGGRISADTASEWGLVSETVVDEELSNRVAVLVDRMRDAPRSALVATKRLLRRAEAAELAAALAAEAEVQNELLASAEFATARDGFLNKRPVSFRGSKA